MLLLLLATDPPLQAASPFALRLVEKDQGFDVLISNRSKKVQLYLPRFALYVRDCRITDDKATAGQPLYFAHYKTLDPGIETRVAHITYATSALDLGHVDMGTQHCSYLKTGRYFVSALFNARTRECRDCTSAQKARIDRVWQGVVRTNELEVNVR